MDLNRARHLAEGLLYEQGLAEWEFQFDRAARRFGSCNYKHKRITLSWRLANLNPEAQVRDTLLHEIAHALAGPGAGHGIRWRHIARTIGCTPERCYGSEVIQPRPRFRAACALCGESYGRIRRPRGSHYCSRCWNSTGARVKLSWETM